MFKHVDTSLYAFKLRQREARESASIYGIETHYGRGMWRSGDWRFKYGAATRPHYSYSSCQIINIAIVLLLEFVFSEILLSSVMLSYW